MLTIAVQSWSFRVKHASAMSWRTVAKLIACCKVAELHLCVKGCLESYWSNCMMAQPVLVTWRAVEPSRSPDLGRRPLSSRHGRSFDTDVSPGESRAAYEPGLYACTCRTPSMVHKSKLQDIRTLASGRPRACIVQQPLTRRLFRSAVGRGGHYLGPRVLTCTSGLPV
jgi:hypothetical protein